MNPRNGFDNKSKTLQARSPYLPSQELTSTRAFTNTDYQAWSKKLAQDESVKKINANFGKKI